MAKKDTKQITMEDFDRTFVPINNHFADDDAIFHFETYGKELEFVLSQDKNKIWTIVDSSINDNMYLISGYHLVNRVGYIITENPFGADEDYEILYHEDMTDNMEDIA